MDYRRINEVTQTDSYPIPRVDVIIDQLGKAKFITTLDWRGAIGKYQLPLSTVRKPHSLPRMVYTSSSGCPLD